MKNTLINRHGGNIYRIRRESSNTAVLDFSASINPLGIPKGAQRAIMHALKESALSHYPDPEMTELKKAIASSYDIDSNSVMAANGSTELIYLIPRALRPQTVLLTSPTFSEFERASLVAGAKIKRVSLKRGQDYRLDPSFFIDAMKAADLAVICNPNNPTALALERESILEIAEAARKMKCFLIIDEAFMDFCPEHSVLGTDNPFLIVLRSMTKFYALAGLRLGFGCFPPPIRKKLDSIKEPWSVNTLSQLAGVEVLKDTNYRKRTLNLIGRERAFLMKEIAGTGLKPYHSDANYILVKCSNASRFSREMLKKGVAVRDCSNFRGMGNSHIRVAVRSREDNQALISALQKVQRQVS